MNKLIMMMGLPRSGKSTWAKAQGFPIVSPDAIRLALTGQRWWSPIEHQVHATARTMVRALFLAGNDTVILDDARTSLTKESREKWRASDDVPWKRYVQIIDERKGLCTSRAITAGQLDVIDVIEEMWQYRESVDSFVEDITIWGEIRE